MTLAFGISNTTKLAVTMRIIDGIMACRCYATIGEVATYDNASRRHTETGYSDIELEVGPVGQRDIVVCAVGLEHVECHDLLSGRHDFRTLTC